MIKVLSYNLPDLGIIDSPLPLEVCVWRPDTTCLVLGQSNQPETSLHVESVLQDNIPVYKRPSGGETVILTPNTMVISIAFTVDSLKNPKQYFVLINNTLITALTRMDIHYLSQKGISDIAIGEKKILGSAIYRRPNRVFYHAVLNVAEDIATIARYIRHPAKEPDYRKGRPHAGFVTSLKAEGYKVPLKNLISDLEKELSTTLAGKL